LKIDGLISSVNFERSVTVGKKPQFNSRGSKRKRKKRKKMQTESEIPKPNPFMKMAWRHRQVLA